MQHPPPAVEIRALSKSFGRPAVRDLDLVVHPGELFALLGPNGAGKTTTLRMLAGLLEPDRGSISVFGIDVLASPIEAKRIMAWLPDEPLVYDRLTPLEYLDYVGGLWSVEPALLQARAEALLQRLGLWPHRDERCEGFSRGMRQKLMMAGALLHDPRLMILDEPLTGLDAAASRDVKTLLSDRTRAGDTIIVTTHILEVAERIADRIGIIVDGQVRAIGTLDELRIQSGQAGTLEDVFLALVKAAGPDGLAAG